MATKHRGIGGRPAGPLIDLYERYVGEPRSRKDVYGYWTFLAGYALGVVGVAVYLAGTTPGGEQFLVREVSITLSAVGLAFALFGFGLMLPVRRRGIYLSVLGLLVAMGAVVAFVLGYPADWIAGTDYSGTVILVYTVGVGVVAGVAALVPVLTGEKGWLVEDLEDYSGHPPVLVGEALHGALFSVYKLGTGRWTWRVLQQDAVAENAGGPHGRPDVEAAVEETRRLIGDAGLLEITTAAFRLYEGPDGTWRWTLMREDGGAVAVSGADHADRDAAEGAASLLKEEGPDAPVVDIRGAAFDIYEAEGGWHWRLLDEARLPLATSATPFVDRAGAESAVEPVRERFDDARVIAIDELGVELFEADGAWRWRVVDATDEVLATGADVHESRRAAESAVGALLPGIAGAPTLEPDRPAFELYDAAQGWQFRLMDGEGGRIADGGGAFVDQASAREAAQRMSRTATDADVIQYEGGCFETHPGEDGWRWRLVTDDRELVASSAEGYPDRAAAEAAVEGVRERALVADLIEFEHAAFQQYESEGRWRWRLIDADGTVLADSGDDYASPDEVGDAMRTLKEQAPQADILEIETAAFELFEDAGGWGWRLIDETGAMVAQGADRHPTREEAREAMDYLVDHTQDADIREMARPAFQFYADADTWRWRYVGEDGAVIAEGTEGQATRDGLVAAVAEVREQATGADVHAIDPLAFELLDGGAPRYRLIDADRTVVAESPRRYDSRGELDAVVSRLQEHAGEATVFAIGDGAIRLAPSGGAWGWELVDGDRSAIATAPSTFADRDEALASAQRAGALAPDAKLVDFDSAAFELYRDAEGDLRWRLIDDEGAVVATAAEPLGSPGAARTAVDDVKGLVGDASVLEIDEAAYELHRDDDGWSWRLVDDHGTTLVRSIEPLETRAAARAALNEVKRYAPDGRITVVD